MANQEVEANWLKENLPEILKYGKLVDGYVPEKLKTLQINDISVDLISKEEAFMLTVCYRAKVNFDYDNKNYIKNLVVKKTPNIEEEDYKFLNFDNLFGNEIAAYTDIFPALEKFTGEKYQGPQLFYSKKEPFSATLIMEDFGSYGWKITKDRYDLSLDHIVEAARVLGNFHGSTFAFKLKHPEQLKDLLKNLKEPRYVRNEIPEMWNVTIEACMKRLTQVALERCKELGEKFIHTIVEMIRNNYECGKYFVEPREPLATICHGDYLRNNVAYKYVGEKPIDVMMFDLQTIRYSSPMVDLTLFMNLSAMAHVRQPNFDLIFDTYVEALNTQFTKLTNNPVPDFLQRDSLLKEYIRVWPLSFCATSFFLMMLIDPESAPNLEDKEMTNEKIVEIVMKAAGETYDAEVSNQLQEFHQLCQSQKINIHELYADFF